MTTTIRQRKVCPACDGRGKSYGTHYCGACKGKNWVTEKITIDSEFTAMEAALKEMLQ